MEQPQPHVLILPFPAQGHIKPMLCLAQLLCNAGIHVTFINSHHNHSRLIHSIQALSCYFPTLHFESISDGLSEDDPRSLPSFPDLVSSIKSVTKHLFRELLVSLNRGSGPRPPVTCVIADGIMSFSIDVAAEFGTRVIIFRTFSACCLWIYLCVPKLIAEGQLPFGADDDLEREIEGVPGMEGILRRRDLPHACRSKQIDDPLLQFFVNETLAMTRASSIILNTFEELEAPFLSQIARLVPNIYTIGPLHALTKSRNRISISPTSSLDASLIKEDRSCMTWLDSQPLRSVLYVSFGSLFVLTRLQLLEFWHGLVNSGQRFLWVLRPDMMSRDENARDVIPSDVTLGTQEKWCIVGWAPQEEVLAHPAVGGFLTHSGWNSTLESIVAGVPLICWPQLSDQMVNSRWVSEIWRIGLDMKDTCDRSTVEKMVRVLMEEKRAEIMKSVDQFAGLARDSISQFGSSNKSLQKLIEDLKIL
ncbi:Glycosyltransferase [Melia azedarach]|uniref:Glycosyltransferase n=1 Tax=Melia azedarach TaxID=155640 RepID=A0ACC1X0X6_MELAZ|nr:Glycosyltransferase [Melia azedarach]